MQNYEYIRMPRISYKLLPVLILAAALFVGYVIIAQAQGVEPRPTSPDEVMAGGPAEEEIAASGITFPVTELGGCRDKTECKTYCEKPANMPACISFAEKHGLMSKEEAAFSRKFKDQLDVGGPGGCRTPRDCQAYCGDITNIEECMAFAEKQGIDDKNIQEGRKILVHIRAGGKMPGGCTSKESCEPYCASADNFEECIEFAEKVGFEPEIEGDLSREQVRTVMGLMKRGESPGGCKSKNECELYCNNPDHFEECIAFAEKAGFMRPEEVEMARKTGGMGPAGCRTPRECEAYCNAPANQEECFKFAGERGLLREDDMRRMKEGTVQMRAGLENTPPEVAACLKASLGPNVINDIQSGSLTPGSAIGEKARACFERFGQRGAPQEIFEHAPPEVLSCAKEKLGDNFEKIRSGEMFPTPEMADTFRVCFQTIQLQGEMMGGQKEMMMGDEGGRPGGQMGKPSPEMIEGFLRNAPPQIASCLKENLGGAFEKMRAGEMPLSPEIGEQMKSCFEEFRPPMNEGFGPPAGGFDGAPGGLREQPGSGGGGFPSPSDSGGGFIRPPMPGPGASGFDFGNLPQTVFDCVKRAFGEDVVEKLKSGAFPVSEFAAKAKSCLFEFGGGSGSGTSVPPSDGGTLKTGTVCPAMPTVESCPAGQVRVVAFSSSECGTYYACKLGGEGSTGGTYPYQLPPDQNYQQVYPLPYPTQTYPAPTGQTPTTDSGYTQPPPSGIYEQQPSGGYTPPPGGNIFEVFGPLLFFLR